jgi:hypothetical protein
MQRYFPFRQGDRAEYLAQYILSALAITVPVPRPEDVGTDFHCSLLRRDGDNLRPSLPFNIQIKKSGDDVLKKGVRYGGLTDAGVWKLHEITQFCQTDSPFLIGIVNLESQRLDIFTTITRYFVLSNWLGKGLPRQIAMIPYDPVGEGHLGAGVQEDLDPKPIAPHRLWKLPLGQPIVSIAIEESEDEKRCEEIKALLEPYLRMDQENAVCFRIGLGYFLWPLIIRPNQPLHEIGVGLAAGGFASPNTQKQLSVLTRITASLLRSYQTSGMKLEILSWESIVPQLPFGKEQPIVGNWVKEAIAYAHS